MMPVKRIAPRKYRLLLAFASLALAVGFTSFQAAARETLTRVQSRRMLNCGVSDGRVGFSYRDAKGRWAGLDVDFCRAVAAAAIGDAERVKFVPLLTAARFLALRSNEIDVLSRNTTWTIGREAGLGVHFVGTLFYDGQAFMVPVKGRAKKIADLNGASICVVERTTSEENLVDHFGSRGWSHQAIVSKSMDEASRKFFAGQCGVYTSDRSNLAAVRLNAPGGPQNYVILPEQISKEPLGPAIRQGDEDWLVLLKWIYFAVIAAEELGVTSRNTPTKTQLKSDARLAKFLDSTGAFAKLLDLKPGWVPRILQSVGNYGEMFERNLGQGSALKLDRGLNQLWSQGGLMYAPPFL
jgi:general L-amino acid transport system substrate-binding protein